MQITFPTASERMEFLGNYDQRIKIVDAKRIEDSDYESYWVTFEIPEHYSVADIAQLFFHAGASYGLQLDYSSYGTEPSR